MRLSDPITDEACVELGWWLTDVGASIEIEEGSEVWLAYDRRHTASGLSIVVVGEDDEEYLGPASTMGDLVRAMRLHGLDPVPSNV